MPQSGLCRVARAIPQPFQPVLPSPRAAERSGEPLHIRLGTKVQVFLNIQIISHFAKIGLYTARVCLYKQFVHPGCQSEPRRLSPTNAHVLS